MGGACGLDGRGGPSPDRSQPVHHRPFRLPHIASQRGSDRGAAPSSEGPSCRCGVTQCAPAVHAVWSDAARMVGGWPCRCRDGPTHVHGAVRGSARVLFGV